MANIFSTLFGGGAEAEAADKNRALTAQYQGNALDALKTGYGTSTGYLDKSVAAYDPLASLGQKYGGAGDLWMDALGVNGPAGNTRAQSSFQTTPGFDIARKAGEEAIARRRAISGGYDAGKTDMDLNDYVTSSLYGTQYQPWLTGLQSAAGMGGQYTAGAAAGQAAGYGGLAGLATQYGTDQTNVYGTATSNNIAANNLEAAGEAAGAKNLLGAGLSLATLAAGGNPFGGSLLKKAA